MDFQFVADDTGRAIKVASIVDEHTLECLDGIVARSITGADLPANLHAIAAQRGLPEILRYPNGPELISQAMADWAVEVIGLHYIPPGSPWCNGYVESFNSRIRDKCLNITSSWPPAHARVIIKDWKKGVQHEQKPLITQVPRSPAEYAEICAH